MLLCAALFLALTGALVGPKAYATRTPAVVPASAGVRSPMAPPPRLVTTADGPGLQFAVAHIHNAGFCYGEFTISAHNLRYDSSSQPEHSFQYARTDLESAEKGGAYDHLTLRFHDHGTYRFVLTDGSAHFTRASARDSAPLYQAIQNFAAVLATLQAGPAPVPAAEVPPGAAAFLVLHRSDKEGDSGLLTITPEQIRYQSGSNPALSFTHQQPELDKVEAKKDGSVVLHFHGAADETLSFPGGPGYLLLALSDIAHYPIAPPPGAAASLSVGQADAMVRGALHHLFSGTGGNVVRLPATGVQVTEAGFNVLQEKQYATGKFAGQDDMYVPSSIAARFAAPNVYLTYGATPFGVSGAAVDYPDKHRIEAFRQAWSAPDVVFLGFTSAGYGHAFVDGFNRLVYAAYHPGQQKAAWVQFQAQADAWRTLNPKPGLSDAADRERVLAENAVAEKDPDSALEHYQAAVAAQPMWPEGWYNAGILAGEMLDYQLAIDDMQHYLTLVPGANDATAVRDKIIVWQDKLAQSDPAAAPLPAPAGVKARKQ